MLIGQTGIRLLLLVGETVPLPAPYALTSAVTRIQVTSDAEGGDGFQMTVKVARDAVLDYSVIAAGHLDPFKRIVVAVLFGVVPEVLIDGVVTNQQFTPSDEPGGSTLTVTGKDVSQMLDLEERNDEFPNQPDALIATRRIAEYAQYGLVPAVTPTTDVPIQLQRVPRQAETDLALLRRMAQRNGFVFYVEPLLPGVSTAYWGPENRLGLPQPALTLGMGAAANVKGLHFTQDGMGPVGTKGSFLEPVTGAALPIPPLPPLKVPPLAAIPFTPRRTRILRETAQANPAQAALTAVSTATRAPDLVSAQGEVDTVKYGHALRARKLVGVRGVGWSYDGLYYVRQVSHTITPGEYKQSFTLSRDGTGSTVPAVLP
ncbi:MAG TPA: hypothetical protein VHG91_16880 [Longimicrobium sp.]|nr:hypothetical protein [Longimicrobium sp.]